MLKAITSTVLSAALGTTAWAAPQAPPPPAPAPPSAPAPAQPPERAEAPRTRVLVGRVAQRPRGPWTELAGDALTATFAGAAGDVLELSNAAGDIVIATGRGDTGRIVARRTVGGRSEAEVRALLARMRLDVSQHAQRVVVRAEPAPSSARYRLDYEITLPKGMGVDVRSMAGGVTLAGVTGDVRVEALQGDIDGKGLTRVRSLRTMSGDIRVMASTLVGEAQLHTVSGDLTASALEATSLTLGTVSGDVHLTDVRCMRVAVQTVNGDIRFASPARGGGRYELKSHAGDIVVATGARTAGYEFTAQSFKGAVTSADTGAVRGQGHGPVSGRVGDGSAFFELTSFVGDIRVGK